MDFLNNDCELMSNEIVDIVMAFITTRKVDCIFFEENNLKTIGKDSSITLTIIVNKGLSFDEDRKIGELLNEFERKYNIKISIVSYDTYNFGLFDLYSNHQNKYTYEFEPNCRPYCLKNRLYDRIGKYEALQGTYNRNISGKNKTSVVSVLPVAKMKKLILARTEEQLAS